MKPKSFFTAFAVVALLALAALAAGAHVHPTDIAAMSMAGVLAAFTSETYNPDKLIYGESDDLVSLGITLLSGQNCVRGTVLGKITLGAASSAAKSGGNTGNGTMTLDATTPILAFAQVGIYTVRCIAAAANSGTFEVKDPQGNSLGQVVVGATFADQLKFVIADGSADFIVGDGFDLTVAAGSGKYVKSLAAALDGSQAPDAILVEDTDASAADVATIGFFQGQFNENALTLGAGHTADSIREGLREKGIILQKAIAA